MHQFTSTSPRAARPTGRLIQFAIRSGMLAGAMILSGCAVMSEQECRTTDWYEQGMRDALDAQPRSYLGEIRDDCLKAGVRPNEAAYMQGWNRGIVQFCTPENGWRRGRNGQSYERSCPTEIENDFLPRYHDGLRIWRFEQQLQSLQDRMSTKEREYNNSRDDAQRNRLRSELRDLDSRIQQAREELYRAENRVRY